MDFSSDKVLIKSVVSVLSLSLIVRHLNHHIHHRHHRHHHPQLPFPVRPLSDYIQNESLNNRN